MRACCSTQLVPKPPTSSEEVFASESWDLGFGSWSTCCRIASVLSFCLSDPSPTSTTPSPSPHHIPNPLFSTSTIAPAPNPLPLAYELGGKQQNKNKALRQRFLSASGDSPALIKVKVCCGYKRKRGTTDEYCYRFSL